MSSTKSPPASVLERFPDRSRLIIDLYSSDDDFRELVDHFDECERVLGQLLGSAQPDRTRIDEYHSLLAELREETRLALEANRNL